MAKRAKILVAGQDLHDLSRIYLSLIHKDHFVEATDKAGEILPRVNRFKPRILVLHEDLGEGLLALVPELAKLRIPLIWVSAENTVPDVLNRRAEHFKLPMDTCSLELKIREMLNLIEL